MSSPAWPSQRARPGPTGPPLPVPGGHRGNTLGLRLALAFLGVALAAIALIAVLTAVFSAVDVSSLASRQRSDLAGIFAVAAGTAWQQHQSWDGADLGPVRAQAARGGVQLQVRDAAGHPVTTTSGFPAGTGTTTSAPFSGSKAAMRRSISLASTCGMSPRQTIAPSACGGTAAMPAFTEVDMPSA